MDKRMKNRINCYNNSSDTSLNDVYKKYSYAKKVAWEYCIALCKYYNGKNLKVIGHNCNFFSAGFTFVDKETGVIKFMYIAPTYNREVDYDYWS